jgi:flagellar motor component MotA
MGKLEIAGKGTLFAIAISIITAGSQLISTNFEAGLSLLIVGVALVIIWAVLIDWQAKREAMKAAQEAFSKFKLELEEKTRG